MDIILYSILTFEIGYIAILVYMYLWQRRILFKPERDLLHPSQYGFDGVEDVVLMTEDNMQLGCWYIAPPKENGLMMLYLHGNTGHMGDVDRVAKLEIFRKQSMGICAPSYRSYGNSDGRPSEEGLYRDARAAIRYILAQGVAESQIIIYGESLGTGIAVQIACEFPTCKLLVLEAPYTSTADRGSERYPYLPVYLLMKDHFDSLSKIPDITMPTIIFHGMLDETMPVHHGKTMLAAVTARKKGVFYNDVHHIDFDYSKVAQEVVDFI